MTPCQGCSVPQMTIIKAISESDRMVLISSAHANTFPRVTRELTKAVSNGAIIIPFRLEDVPLSESIEYLPGFPHGLDALTPPLERQKDNQVKTVNAFTIYAHESVVFIKLGFDVNNRLFFPGRNAQYQAERSRGFHPAAVASPVCDNPRTGNTSLSRSSQGRCGGTGTVPSAVASPRMR